MTIIFFVRRLETDYLEPERVGRTGDVAKLPVDVPLNAGDVKEHVHPGKVGGHGEGREAEIVGDVDGGAALHGHVKHLDVVIHHRNMRRSASMCVLVDSTDYYLHIKDNHCFTLRSQLHPLAMRSLKISSWSRTAAKL